MYPVKKTRKLVGSIRQAALSHPYFKEMPEDTPPSSPDGDASASELHTDTTDDPSVSAEETAQAPSYRPSEYAAPQEIHPAPPPPHFAYPPPPGPIPRGPVMHGPPPPPYGQPVPIIMAAPPPPHFAPGSMPPRPTLRPPKPGGGRSTKKPFKESFPSDQSENSAKNCYQFSKPDENSYPTKKRKHRSSNFSKWVLRVSAGVAAISLVGFTGLSISNWLTNITTKHKHQTLDTSSATSIIDKYIETNSGLRYLEGIRSLSIRGRLVEEGNSYNFVEIRKRPGNRWLKLESGSNTTITAFDSETSWKQMEEENGSVEVATLSEPDAEKLKNHFFFLNPLVDYALKARTDATLVEQTEDSFAVKIDNDETNTQVVVYIDQGNFQIRRIEQEMENGAKVQHIFSEHTLIDGIWLPFEIQRLEEGKEPQKYLVEKAVLNPGVMSSLFRKPAEDKI